MACWGAKAYGRHKNRAIALDFLHRVCVFCMKSYIKTGTYRFSRFL